MSTETPTVAVEVMPPEEAKLLLTVVEQNQIQPAAATALQTSFASHFTGARAILNRSTAIVVTDVSQKVDMKVAREYRLALKNIRIASDKTRAALKEDSLRRSKAIDGFHNILLEMIEPEEKRLDEQEKFAERKEAERLDALHGEREKKLEVYGVDVRFIALREMPDDVFDKLLENSRVAYEAKKEQARKAEEEKIRQENERLKEEARVREENARLRREAEEREAAAKVERERVAAEKAAADEKARLEREAAAAEVRRLEEEKRVAEEQARKEREAAEAEANRKLAEERRKADEAAAAERARVEAEQRAAAEKARLEREAVEAKAAAEKKAAADKAAKAKKLADAKLAEERAAREKLEAEKRAAEAARAKKAAEEVEAARLAALAPDREKLIAFACAVRALKVPDLSPESLQVGMLLAEKIEKLAATVEAEAEGLGLESFAAIN